jgi:hypothetical protein
MLLNLFHADTTSTSFLVAGVEVRGFDAMERTRKTIFYYDIFNIAVS